MALISARRVWTIDNSIGPQVSLQQTHGALDVDTYGARVNVRRRNHHTADRRTIAAVGIWIEHEVGDSRRGPRVDGLLKATLVKRGADRLSADHGDRFVITTSRQDGGRLTVSGNREFARSCVHVRFHRRAHSSFAFEKAATKFEETF